MSDGRAGAPELASLPAWQALVAHHAEVGLLQLRELFASDAGCRFPFKLSLLIFHLAQLTLSMCHRGRIGQVTGHGFPARRLANVNFANHTLVRRW